MLMCEFLTLTFAGGTHYNFRACSTLFKDVCKSAGEDDHCVEIFCREDMCNDENHGAEIGGKGGSDNQSGGKSGGSYEIGTAGPGDETGAAHTDFTIASMPGGDNTTDSGKEEVSFL